MRNRGLRASIDGIKQAKLALTDKAWSQSHLAELLGISRQPIAKFFTGQSVDRLYFVQICQKLDLRWQVIVDLPQDAVTEKETKFHQDAVAEKETKFQVKEVSKDIDAIVYQIRQTYQEKIQHQCGSTRLLNIPRAIALNDIYIHVQVLSEIASQKWRQLSDLSLDSDPSLRSPSVVGLSGSELDPKRLSGVYVASRHSKLVVLGKPGSGKTMFLQYLALQCSEGKFQNERIPVFIQLKAFVEHVNSEHNFNLFNYIDRELRYDSQFSRKQIKALLNHGRALILLDGLDEVPVEIRNKIFILIQEFSEAYYKNFLVISYRTSTIKYQFPGFTEVEMADWEIGQIKIFAEKWFAQVYHLEAEAGKALSNQLIKHLNLAENQTIQALATRPLYLHLICLSFQPSAKLPCRRANLYKQILEVLLIEWDESKGVYRDSANSDLTWIDILELLCQISIIAFESENNCFEVDQIQDCISDYPRWLREQEHKRFQVWASSTVMLKMLTVQYGLLTERSHGIYSFSHAFFYEYFIAKYISTYPNSNSSNKILDKVFNNSFIQEYQNIFLLACETRKNIDTLLLEIKRRADDLITNDGKLQKFLDWLQHKSNSISTSSPLIAIRSFYLVNELALAHIFTKNSLDRVLYHDTNITNDLRVDHTLSRVFVCAEAVQNSLGGTQNLNMFLDYVEALTIALTTVWDHSLEPQLRRSLQEMSAQLPKLNENEEKLKQWWSTHGEAWTQQLRALIIEHRNIGRDWQFSQNQKKLLHQYHDANLLLIWGLARASAVTPVVRQQLEETLLLPR